VAGARALGGLQGVLLLVRPFTMFAIAAVGASTSEVAHAIGNRGRIWRHTLFSSGLCGAIAALNGLVMLVLPTKLGKLVLGDSWHVAHPLLAAAGVYILCIGLLTGPQAGLYGIRAMKEAMAINVATMVMLLVGALIGALADGVKGGLWAVAAVQAILVIVWWTTFAARLRREVSVAAPARPGSPAAVIAAAMRVEPLV
jgi:O-antigen/teichoic acid export membrane protein